MNAVTIIPARYASTRFPGKPLAMLGGMTVIERTYRQAASVCPRVVVATDDERIAAHVRAFGGEAVMTSPDHPSGTSRVAEARRLATPRADVVVNLQGDEPLIPPDVLTALADAVSSPGAQIATAVYACPQSMPYDTLADPNLVKVVTDHNGRAMYFSRSVIPAVRDLPHAGWPSVAPYLLHAGVYAYTARVLDTIAALPPSPLEAVERLEQLRWLQAGFRIDTVMTAVPAAGIDTPADLERARALFEGRQP